MYMLDTNICSYVIKQHPPQVLEKFETIAADQLGISVITLAELQYGVMKSSKPAFNQNILDEFVSYLDIWPWEIDIVKIYGEIRTDLERKGTPIGAMDLMIAAHCLSLDCILVTNNLREFERVPDLAVENWV